MFNFDKKIKKILKKNKLNAQSFLTTPVLKGLGAKTPTQPPSWKHSFKLNKFKRKDFHSETTVPMMDYPTDYGVVGHTVQMQPNKFIRTTQREAEYRGQGKYSQEEYERQITGRGFKATSPKMQSYKDRMIKHRAGLAKAIAKKSPVVPMPYLETKRGVPVGHEGRHRAILAREVGMKTIPVRMVETDKEFIEEKGLKGQFTKEEENEDFRARELHYEGEGWYQRDFPEYSEDNKLPREDFPRWWGKHQTKQYEKERERAAGNYFKDGFKPWMRKKTQKEIEEEIEDDYIREHQREFDRKQKLKRKAFGKPDIAYKPGMVVEDVTAKHLQLVQKGQKDMVLFGETEFKENKSKLPYLLLDKKDKDEEEERIYYNPTKKDEAIKLKTFLKKNENKNINTAEYHADFGYHLGYSKPEVFTFIKRTLPKLSDDKINMVINDLEKVDNVRDNMMGDDDGDGVNNATDCSVNDASRQGGHLYWKELEKHKIDVSRLPKKERKIIRTTFEKRPELLEKASGVQFREVREDKESVVAICGRTKEGQDTISISKDGARSHYGNICEVHTPIRRQDVPGQLLVHELQHLEDYKKHPELFNEKDLELFVLMEKAAQEGDEKEYQKLLKKYEDIEVEKRAYTAQVMPRERDIKGYGQAQAYRNLMGDDDGDGVNNVMDCDPQDETKQGYLHQKYATLYHGTSQSKLPSIMKVGLKAEKNMFGEPAVFLTPGFQHAVYHASKGKYTNPNLKPAILEVTIPKDETGLTDEQIVYEDHPTREAKIYRNIAPQNIRLSRRAIKTSWGDSDKDGKLNVFDKDKLKRRDINV